MVRQGIISALYILQVRVHTGFLRGECSSPDSILLTQTKEKEILPMKQLHTIYDRIGKRSLSLSQRTTVQLINGLYGTDYPEDSPVDYHWTEHTAEDLRRTLADTIITINHRDSYHMELQMNLDQEIVLRVFEYGYRHALTRRGDSMVLNFPEPMVLYLYETGNTADEEELLVDFGSQGKFLYKVPVFKYLSIPLEELNRRKLIVLIPFQLLRLRREIEKKRTPENIEALKQLISHDIIQSIRENEEAGNISRSDGRKLRQMTLQLYRHIYEKYDELEKEGVNAMAEEALILEIDIIEQEHRKELREKDSVIQEKSTAIQALKLMLKGIPDPDICRKTGLTQAQLDELRENG